MYVTWFTRSVYEATTHMIAICYLRFKDKSHPLSANLISYIQFTLTIFHKKLIPAFCSQTSAVYFNQRFGANSKKLFWQTFAANLLLFCISKAFLHEKHWKWLFQPALGMRSTKALVEIYNKPVLVIVEIVFQIALSSTYLPTIYSDRIFST